MLLRGTHGLYLLFFIQTYIVSALTEAAQKRETVSIVTFTLSGVNEKIITQRFGEISIQRKRMVQTNKRRQDLGLGLMV